MDYKISTKLRELVPGLSQQELERLDADVKHNGVQMPLVVSADGTILDGTNRYRLAGKYKHDLPAPIVMKDVKTDAEKAAVTIRYRENRAQLSFEQQKELRQRKVEVANRLRREEKTQQQIGALLGVTQQTVGVWLGEASVKAFGDACIDLRYTIPKSEKKVIYERAMAGELHRVIAADYKVSRQRIGQIVDKFGELGEGSDSVDPGDLPDIRYRTIVIDPPWPVERGDEKLSKSQPAMTLDQIAAIPITRVDAWNEHFPNSSASEALAEKSGCHVYLWAPHKHMPTAFEIFKGWEVRYECLLTWVKKDALTPFSWQYTTEHVLFGRVGKLALEKKGLRLDFTDSVKKDGRKPDVFYEKVRTASPEPRLDMFGRKEHEGFEIWGSEGCHPRPGST